MALIADLMMIAAALGAAVYCLVLSRRLSKFSDLERGMGGAIAVLSAQVDDMTTALSKAQGSAHSTQAELDEISKRAEAAAKRLELLLAAMHDLPGQDTPVRDTRAEENAPDQIKWRTRRPVGGALR